MSRPPIYPLVSALEAGKHVICEKPLAPTPDDVRQMIAARDQAGKLLMTAQHFRFGADSMAMKQEIDTGALGDIYHARSWMLRRSQAPVSEGFIMKKHSGGGPCIDIGAHWPKCEILESNNSTRQQYNRTLQLRPGGMEAHAQECVEFARAVAEGSPSPVPAEQSLQVMKILDGIYRSQEKGGEVVL
jgi:predicted dehydrogenase